MINNSGFGPGRFVYPFLSEIAWIEALEVRGCADWDMFRVRAE
jgi:hypothetical protein